MSKIGISDPERSRPSKGEIAYWAAFVACQIVGGIASAFANVHTNPLALFGAILLLFPGIAVMDELSRLPPIGARACVILTNFVVWLVLSMRIVSRRQPPKALKATPDHSPPEGK